MENEKMEKLKRSSGVLLHITSLPNAYTLGTFSCEALRLIDWLEAGGFKVWQILPITDCGYKFSPYSAKSSFAINPTLIDLTEFLTETELNSFCFNKNGDVLVEENKILSAIDLIYDKYRNDFELSQFEKENKYWLEDYALYKVIKSLNNNCSWENFPKQLRDRNVASINSFKLEHSKELDRIKFTQFIADKQWKRIKEYASKKDIQILGDMPFYVEMDSADVWSNPKNWKLNSDGKGEVAGVPPDYFNENGQLWGNPIYNYETMAKDKYSFIIKRFKRQAELFNIVRIDHFIAFSRYWAIPKSSSTAVNGRWVKGFGEEILKEIMSKVKVSIIAEDLGVVTREVIDLREKFGIPGLKVLQFAFDGMGDNIYQPHNYEKNCVAYIGTHDNDTFMGLLNNSDWDKLNRFKRYLRIPLEWGNDAVVDNSIISLYRSSANLIVFTMQDILKLGSEARMNTPGVIEGNWAWQLDKLPSVELCGWYKDLANLYAR
ncbi:MAG: 4-alpha-glucanotransferase [Christensenellales bacterium]